MKKVLVFCAGGQGAQEGLQLEEAIEQYNRGNEVIFLSCDEIIGGCNENRNFDKKKCVICKFCQRKNQKHYLPKGIRQISVKNLVSRQEIEYWNKQAFSYNSIESIRNIKFHNVEIGLGAISSYISFTRNLEPVMDDTSRRYFDRFLKSQVIMTLAIERLQKENKFDLFILHNGRFAIFKPMLNIAQRDAIDYICTESFQDSKGYVSKDYYYNDMPHNIGSRHLKYEKAWEDAKLKGIERENIGRSFFERRRNAQGTGDKIYTIGQGKSCFVDNWDDFKENIVIFNSSEDEFCAVGGDFEKAKIFSTQMEGIIAIVEHYKNDFSKHFYLRVHPNLISVKYAYHFDLYKLDYPNLTVIPANSPISSYMLLNKANKIITFGSTMGIEATYAHKPSICIGAAFYDRLNVVYQPKSVEEVWKYIDNKRLNHLYSENVLVYGYYLMAIYNSILSDYCKYIDNHIYKIKLFGKYREVRGFQRFMNSKTCYLAVRFIFNRL